MASTPLSDEFRNHLSAVAQKIGDRSANLFLTRQLWCSGSVLVVLNRTLGGGLEQTMAIRLCAGLGDGLGGSGCLCGGLNGAVLALGLFLGNGRRSPGGDQKVLQATRKLHRQFKAIHGATCCRILTKHLTMGTELQYQACAQRTASAAGLATEAILEHRPALLDQVDWNYLNGSDSGISTRLKIVADWLKN